MDFLKKAAGELQGNKNTDAAATGNAQQAAGGSAPAADGAAQSSDYGDKGMSFFLPFNFQRQE